MVCDTIMFDVCLPFLFTDFFGREGKESKKSPYSPPTDFCYTVDADRQETRVSDSVVNKELKPHPSPKHEK